MSLSMVQLVYLLILLGLANLPWLSQRCFLVLECPLKRVWVRLLEWLILFFVTLGLGLALEMRQMGDRHPQDWEFFVVLLCLFMVAAFPGFIYRYIR
ncbi:MAG: DUF2818 family protein [Thiothrix sp.]|nr:DUF2818 family protein [Thiothrix sp.]HPQ96706.1 DUF2818 family protein [Thiolinea sp.]